MIVTVARVMLLTLLRDRGALAILLLMPPAIFLIFAAIFATTSGGEIDLRVGLTAPVPAPAVEAALVAAPSQTVRRFASEDALRRAVTEGGVDAGLVLRGALGDIDAPPVTILVDPGKAMAGAVIEGRVRATLAIAAPKIALTRHARQLSRVVGPLTPTQTARLDAAAATPPTPTPGLTETEVVGSGGGPDPAVTYYAGAIAVMFLLFSAAQTAAGLIDERTSGILDRFAAGPGGIDVVVLGKAAFLTAQGMVQAGAVFAAAALFHGVPVTAHLPEWALATLLVAAAAAGLGLLLAAICSSRAQAQTVSTFTILVLSAVGGSMVPRFLMPDWLRDAGLATPNAWAVEVYQGLLFRNLPITALAGPALALAGLGVFGTGAALLLSRRRMRL